MKSLHSLNETLNKHADLRAVVHKRVETAYFPRLNLLSLSFDDNTLYGHAIVNQSIFQAITEKAGIAKDEHGLRGRVALINTWFRTTVLASASDFERHIPKADCSGNLPGYRDHPVYAALWNTGPG